MAGDKDFELYKLLVEDVREVRRARRELANVFMTLNIAGVGALGFMITNHDKIRPELLGWGCVALILCCASWLSSNLYYRRLLRVKFNILYEFEQKIGEYPLGREWAGLGKRTLFNFFSIEFMMPWLFIIGYVVFFAAQISLDEAIAIVKTPLNWLESATRALGAFR